MRTKPPELIELYDKAMKLDRRARRFEKRIKNTLSNAELLKLEGLEEESDQAFLKYTKALKIWIG